jgi:hypothetical protein
VLDRYALFFDQPINIVVAQSRGDDAGTRLAATRQSIVEVDREGDLVVRVDAMPR